jgi:hypothetical protein
LFSPIAYWPLVYLDKPRFQFPTVENRRALKRSTKEDTLPKACVPRPIQQILFFSISSLTIFLCLMGCGGQVAGIAPPSVTPPGSTGSGGSQNGSVQSINRVVLMLQESRSFVASPGRLLIGLRHRAVVRGAFQVREIVSRQRYRSQRSGLPGRSRLF